MFSFFEKWDDKLIKNKPHLWLTQIHVYLPLTMLLLTLCCAAGFLLPLTTNIYWALIAASVICLLFLSYIAYRQRLFFDKLFSASQLNKIYRINLLILVLLFSAVLLIAGILSVRVKNALVKYPFEKAQQSMRIAMIRSDLIQLIKQGMLDRKVRGSLLPSLKKSLSDDAYSQLQEAIYELDYNMFVHNDFSQLDISTIRLGTTTSIAAVDSSIVETDTTLANNSSADTAKPVIADSSDIPYTYSTFLATLRKLPDSTIQSVKQQANALINYYGFSKYTGKDSTLNRGDINGYFELLKKQTLTLDSAANFKNRYDVFLYCILLLPGLANFIFTFIMRHPLVAGVLSLMVYPGLFLLFFLSDILEDNVALISIVLLFITTGYFSKLFRRTYFYSQVHLFCLYLLYCICSPLIGFFLIYLYVNVLDIPDIKLGWVDELTVLLLLFFVVFNLLLQVVNIPFMRAYNRINNLPKG